MPHVRKAIRNKNKMNEAYQAAENHETEPMLIRIPPAPGNCNPIGPATTTGGHPINVTDPGQIIIPEVTTDDENNGNVENHCVLRCATGLLGCVAVVLQLTPIYALNWACSSNQEEMDFLSDYVCFSMWQLRWVNDFMYGGSLIDASACSVANYPPKGVVLLGDCRYLQLFMSCDILALMTGLYGAVSAVLKRPAAIPALSLTIVFDGVALFAVRQFASQSAYIIDGNSHQSLNVMNDGDALTIAATCFWGLSLCIALLQHCCKYCNPRLLNARDYRSIVVS